MPGSVVDELPGRVVDELPGRVVVGKFRDVRVVLLLLRRVVDDTELDVTNVPPGRVVVDDTETVVVVPPDSVVEVLPDSRVVVVVGKPGVLAPGRGIGPSSPSSSHPVNAEPTSTAMGEKQARRHTPRSNVRLANGKSCKGIVLLTGAATEAGSLFITCTSLFITPLPS